MVLQTSPRLTLIASLLVDLAVQIGIPDDTIRVIPGNVDPSIFFTASQVSIISIFDDLYQEKYMIGNHFDKKFLNFYSSGIPMLVFDNCDLDSACQSVINAAWGYKGMLPWSVRNILIQESMFESFTEKLKHRIDKIIIGNSNKKNTDISKPDDEVLQKLENIINKVKREGVDIYQPNSNNPVPTLLIGGNIFTDNVIKEDINDVPIVTLTAFRTINEAVALANNNRQGLAASVWTENTSLAHEIARKLKVSNIWINSHGLFTAEISVSPYKSSGNAYFGGKEGVNEYVNSNISKRQTFIQTSNGEAMEKAINEAKKAQESWSKLTRLERIKYLQSTAQKIAHNKSTWDLPEKWIDDWTSSIHDFVTASESEDGFITQKTFNVISIREPYGTIPMEMMEDIATHNKKLLIAALLTGNSVILLNESESAVSLYSLISMSLPKGVLTVLPSSQSVIKVAALHKELNVYFGEKSNPAFSSLPLKSSSKFKVASSDNWSEVCRKVTLKKNVWFNVGQSFI